MRFIIYGVGAIGGTLAVKLVHAGYDVVGIARGAQLEAIRARGLRLTTPQGDITARFSCVAHPKEIAFQMDDIILLTMKTQDTQAALEALRSAGVASQTIICAQNGVANERMALRLFPNVYAMTVMMPAAHLVPGEVAAFGAPKHGAFDIGRYPSGQGAPVDTVVQALIRSGFAAFADNNVMRSKYGKLLQNLSNIIGVAIGEHLRDCAFHQMARAEGEQVLRAAGIDFADPGSASPRRKAPFEDMPIAGVERIGSSSMQSLVKQSGSIETDYLNGEIVLLGRLHGVPTPVNAYLCRLAQKMVTQKIPAGSFTERDLEAGAKTFA